MRGSEPGLRLAVAIVAPRGPGRLARYIANQEWIIIRTGWMILHRW